MEEESPRPPTTTTTPNIDLPPLLTANIRQHSAVDLAECHAVEGLGREGDVVKGRIQLESGEEVDVLDNKHKLWRIGSTQTVLALLGNRESSTHVNGGLPPQGLQIQPGKRLFWIAGESGLVGDLFRDTADAATNPHKPERSVPFVCMGVVRTKEGRALNALDFALPAVEAKRVLSTPVICVGASAAESGKTTLVCKMVKFLTTKCQLKVAVIKCTGTGGIKDSMQHRAAGAAVTFDQVSRFQMI